jgi:hypothetical protein
MPTPEGLCTACSATQQCSEHAPASALDAITDIVLAYRPTSRSEPSRQRKRRRTILEKKREPKRCERCAELIQDKGGVQ